jgi:hypothetical protein
MGLEGHGAAGTCASPRAFLSGVWSLDVLMDRWCSHSCQTFGQVVYQFCFVLSGLELF